MILSRSSTAFVLVFAWVCVAPSFAGDLGSDIVGKWSTRTPQGDEIMQFFGDGTAITINPDAPQATWSYRVLDGSHIRLDNQSSPIPHPIVVEAGIDGNALTLARDGKIIGRYKRVQ